MRDPSNSVASEQSWVTGDVRFILFTQLVFGFGWSLYLLTPKFLTTVLHAGPETIGTINAMGGASGLLTIPFAGLAIDRLGRRVFFQLGALLLVLLSLGFTQVDHVGPLMYVLQGCISASFVLAFNASAALLADYAPAARLGQAIGWVGGVNVSMNAVSTMIAEPLAEKHGWSMVFGLGVAAGLAALALSTRLREAASRPPRQVVAGPVTGHATAAATRSARPDRQLYGILFATLLMGSAFSAMFGFIQPYAVSVGAVQVRGFFLGFTISAVASRLFLGSLGDRIGRRPVSLWAFLGYGLATYTVRGLVPDLLVLYGLLFGAAHGILYPTLNALVIEVLPAARRGLGMVLYNGAFNVGSSAGSLGWGLLAQRQGYPAVYATAGCLAVSAAVLLRGAAGSRGSAITDPDRAV